MKRGRDEREEGQEGGQQRYSRLDDESLKYYAEIDAHFKTLDNDEDRRLLADNVLEETKGREVEVAPDAACSRVLEALLPHASPASLDTFVRGCIEGENMGAICTSGPFGSHVLEKLLTTLSTAALSAADDTEHAVLEGALSAFTDAASTHLYPMITSKYGSFVARRLLCVLSGHDVSSAPQRRPGASDGEGAAQPAADAAGQLRPKGGGALAARVRTNAAAAGSAYHSAGATSYPQLYAKVAAVVMSDEWTGPDLTALQCDAFAGPFLQSLLRGAAALEDEALQAKLVVHLLGGNAASGPDTLAPDALHRLLTDRNGSHLMEAALATAPDDVFLKLCTAAFKGRVVPLAQHPCANFAVQAALAAVRKPQQLKRMFEDLRPHISTLLRARRGGVVAVLMAASGRVGSLESDAADALWHAVDSGLAADGGATPLHKLLTLDTPTKLGNSAGGGRLSPLGCATAVTVMRFSGQSSKKWADALAALAPGELGAMARDPGGCRVLEAYLEGPGAAPKKKKKMLGALAGSWAAAAATGAGSRFVEKCFDMAETADKESIASDLAAAESRLAATSRGAALLQRCHVAAFKSDGANWQRRGQAADEVRREFEDLFGGDDNEEEAADTPASKKEKKKNKRRKEVAEEEAVEEEGGEVKAETKKKKKKKKKPVDEEET